MLDVLLTTEGTYPFHKGGVGTWGDILIRRMPGVRYHVLAVVSNPYVPIRFRIPDQPHGLLPVPLWGTEEPTEHLDLPFASIYEKKLRTTPSIVRQDFMPMFEGLLDQLWLPEQDGAAVGNAAREMSRFFQTYDYLETFKSETIWDYYKATALKRAQSGAMPDPSVSDLLHSMGWVYRFLTVLATPVPRTHVSHASAAAFCSLPAVVAKLEHRTPMILTEHGVYLREQYLSIGKAAMSPYGKAFLLGLVGAVSRAAMSAADQVSPVASYNYRWENRLGVPEKKFHVIYNGVDAEVFQPRPRPPGAPLTVVSVARVDPVKDLETLMRAAKHVRDEMPQVKFVVYGGVSVPTYYDRLLALREELDLEEGFIFAGHVDNPAMAYQSGDVVALSSISEGFPYAVVEAMMSSRPVVATDVGGTAEALGGCGFLISPQQPEQMARALIKLLRDPALRQQLAEEARDRALTHFTVERQIELYKNSYERLAKRMKPSIAAARVQLNLERAEALMLSGDPANALGRLAAALAANPTGHGAPLVLLRMAEAHLAKGDVEQAWLCSDRAEALAYYLEHAA